MAVVLLQRLPHIYVMASKSRSESQNDREKEGRSLFNVWRDFDKSQKYQVRNWSTLQVEARRQTNTKEIE